MQLYFPHAFSLVTGVDKTGKSVFQSIQAGSIADVPDAIAPALRARFGAVIPALAPAPVVKTASVAPTAPAPAAAPVPAAPAAKA